MKKFWSFSLVLAVLVFAGVGCTRSYGAFHKDGAGGTGGSGNAPPVDDCDVDCDGYVADDCVDGNGNHGDDCDDSTAAVNPGRTEKCGNNVDDDCDGHVDEGCDGSGGGGNGTGGSGNAPNGGTSVDGVACNDTVVYKITAEADLAMSLRLEGGTVPFNSSKPDPQVVDSWVIVPDGEVYDTVATWTFLGCAEDSFRFNVRGWSTVEIAGAPNNDAYACTLYWVDGLSPALTIRRDGVVISHRDDLVNASPWGDGRNCQINGH